MKPGCAEESYFSRIRVELSGIRNQSPSAIESTLLARGNRASSNLCWSSPTNRPSPFRIHLIYPWKTTSRWNSKYLPWFALKAPTFVESSIFHCSKTIGFSSFETSKSPPFLKLINPRSNRWSTCGESKRPLNPSSFSSFEETDHGFIWLARRCLIFVTPVTRQWSSTNLTLALKIPWPRLDFVNWIFSVLETGNKKEVIFLLFDWSIVIFISRFGWRLFIL